MTKPARRRLGIDLSDPSAKKLDEVMGRLNAGTASEAIRRMIDILHRQTEPDTKVYLQNGDGKIVETVFL